MGNDIFELVEESIKQGGEISPFLFLSHNLEILNANIAGYLLDCLKNHKIDDQSLFVLHSTWESLKIWEIKEFIAKSQVSPRFAFQIFLIEDISRMTLQAQNACLKFFEEPWEGNIVVLTSESTSWVLDTILSRLQVHTVDSQKSFKVNDFYYSMISSFCDRSSDELVRYMFSAKLEKAEYVEFLTALVQYLSKNRLHISLLDEIHEDVNGILKNNLQWRYVCDKYILLLS